MTKRRSGFSLIEILAAVAVLLLAIMLIFGAFQLSLKLTKAAREVSVASNIAEEMIDDVRSKLFNDIVINSNPTAVAISELPGGFTKTYVTLYLGNDKIKEVTVKVYWDSRPENRAISVTTLIAQGGINAQVEEGTGTESN